MGTDSEHGKIITQAAREVLAPMGLFRKGQSRIWIDDNDWFLTVVEFQPSAWEKGSFLNIGTNFFWRRQDYFSFDYYSGINNRVESFAEFSGDSDDFHSGMMSYAKNAASYIEEYRRLNDVQYAKEAILQFKPALKSGHRMYHNMMICGLARDNQAVEFYKELLVEAKTSEYDYIRAYSDELSKDISGIIQDTDRFHDYVVSKVLAQRAFWRAKSSMKKLKEEISLD